MIRNFHTLNCSRLKKLLGYLVSYCSGGTESEVLVAERETRAGLHQPDSVIILLLAQHVKLTVTV